MATVGLTAMVVLGVMVAGIGWRAGVKDWTRLGLLNASLAGSFLLMNRGLSNQGGGFPYASITVSIALIVAIVASINRSVWREIRLEIVLIAGIICAIWTSVYLTDISRQFQIWLLAAIGLLTTVLIGLILGRATKDLLQHFRVW